MNPSRTIYNSFLTGAGEFDTSKFIESILLFDKTMLSGVAVLPKLIQTTGPDGTQKLFESGLIGVVGGGANAQGTYDFINPGFFRGRPLDRPLRYGFETIFVDHTRPGNPSPQELLERELKKTKEYFTIDDSKLLKIFDTILPTMKIIHGSQLTTGDDFRADLKGKREFIITLIVELLAKSVNRPVQNLNWKVDINEVSPDIYQIDTNFSELLKIGELQLHELMKAPFFQITGLNLALKRMQVVNAAAGLTETQAHILERRVDFLTSIHLESDKRKRFSEILEIADIPTLAAGSNFDVESLIKLRETDAARSFRDWIQGSQKFDKKDIQKQIGDWRKQLGEKLRTKNAKGMRLLISTGVGTVIGPVGSILSGIDYFLDKFFPGMGPIGFVIGEYRDYMSKQLRKE